MTTGVVKVWKESEGWGFIYGDDGYDYFFNISNVRKGQKILNNKRVKFDIFQGSRGAEAENVTMF